MAEDDKTPSERTITGALSSVRRDWHALQYVTKQTEQDGIRAVLERLRAALRNPQ